jgi:hypothetical protein
MEYGSANGTRCGNDENNVTRETIRGNIENAEVLRSRNYKQTRNIENRFAVLCACAHERNDAAPVRTVAVIAVGTIAPIAPAAPVVIIVAVAPRTSSHSCA